LSAALGVDLGFGFDPVLDVGVGLDPPFRKSNVNSSGQECPLYTGLYRIRM
jgi:hypothetical protein